MASISETTDGRLSNRDKRASQQSSGSTNTQGYGQQRSYMEPVQLANKSSNDFKKLLQSAAGFASAAVEVSYEDRKSRLSSAIVNISTKLQKYKEDIPKYDDPKSNSEAYKKYDAELQALQEQSIKDIVNVSGKDSNLSKETILKVKNQFISARKANTQESDNYISKIVFNSFKESLSTADKDIPLSSYLGSEEYKTLNKRGLINKQQVSTTYANKMIDNAASTPVDEFLKESASGTRNELDTKAIKYQYRDFIDSVEPNGEVKFKDNIDQSIAKKIQASVGSIMKRASDQFAEEDAIRVGEIQGKLNALLTPERFQDNDSGSVMSLIQQLPKNDRTRFMAKYSELLNEPMNIQVYNDHKQAESNPSHIVSSGITTKTVDQNHAKRARILIIKGNTEQKKEGIRIATGLFASGREKELVTSVHGDFTAANDKVQWARANKDLLSVPGMINKLSTKSKTSAIPIFIALANTDVKFSPEKQKQIWENNLRDEDGKRIPKDVSNAQDAIGDYTLTDADYQAVLQATPFGLEEAVMSGINSSYEVFEDTNTRISKSVLDQMAIQFQGTSGVSKLDILNESLPALFNDDIADSVSNGNYTIQQDGDKYNMYVKQGEVTIPVGELQFEYKKLGGRDIVYKISYNAGLEKKTVELKPKEYTIGRWMGY